MKRLWELFTGLLMILFYIPFYFISWCVGIFVQAIKAGYKKGLKG